MPLQDYLIQRFTTWSPPSPVVLSKSKRDVTLSLIPDEPFGLLKEYLLYKVVKKTKIPPWNIVYSGGKSVKTIDNLAACNPHQFKVKIIIKASAVHKLSEIFLNKYGDEETVYKYFDKLDKDYEIVNIIENNEEYDKGDNMKSVTKEETDRNKFIVDAKGDFENDENTSITAIHQDLKPKLNNANDNIVMSKNKIWNTGDCVREPKVKRWLESEWSAETWCSTDSDGTSAACFCMTVQGGYIKQVQMLLDERPALLEIINSNNGFTPLATAVRKGDIAMVKFLLSCGADVEGRSASSHTPLHLAALAGNCALVDLLIDKGADITARDINGLRVEHFAVESGSAAAARRVLRRGGDLAVTDRHGWTPLFRAVVEGASTELIEELVRHGADVAVADRAGLTLPTLAAGLTNKNGRRRSSVRRLVDASYPQAAARAHYTRLTRKIHTIHTLTQL